MPVEINDGDDKGEVFLYALSTCVWCRRVKDFLESNKIKFSYIYMDRSFGPEKEKMREQLQKWNPECSYPTLVLNNSKCIVGFDADAILKELK